MSALHPSPRTARGEAAEPQTTGRTIKRLPPFFWRRVGGGAHLAPAAPPAASHAPIRGAALCVLAAVAA